MKGFIFSLGGLLIGALVVWSTALPTSLGNTSIMQPLIGGWTIGGGCCTHDSYELCQLGEYPIGQNVHCTGSYTLACWVAPDPDNACKGHGRNGCVSTAQTPPGYEWVCDTGLDTTCDPK